MSRAGIFSQETSKCLIILEKNSHHEIWDKSISTATISTVGTVKGNARVALQKFPESMVTISDGQTEKDE